MFLAMLVVVTLFTAVESATVAAQDATEPQSIAFSRMSADRARTELLQWLAQVAPEENVARRITEQWADNDALARLSGEQLLDLLLESFAAADPAARRLVNSTYGGGPIENIVFDGARGAEIFRNQVMQYRARWLTQHRFYDEALALLEELSPEAVVDPAGLFFYRAVCQSQLLQRRAALDSLSLLLNNTLDVPDRFRAVGQIMLQELGGRKDDGLPLVERLMSDVERRFDLGRSGEKVQEQEQNIIAALDKLLDEMDRHNQQQQQDGSGDSGGSQDQPSGNAATESRIKGSAAEGDADRKNLTEEGAWGMADKQAEAKARELIRRQFPSNYLDAISRYTQRLAEQKK
ncbi:MAG: hypothetical protein R3C19_04150 [Planctomycetaceae bacterium]